MRVTWQELIVEAKRRQAKDETGTSFSRLIYVDYRKDILHLQSIE